MSHDTVALFVCIDDFCKIFESFQKHRLIPEGVNVKCCVWEKFKQRIFLPPFG